MSTKKSRRLTIKLGAVLLASSLLLVGCTPSAEAPAKDVPQNLVFAPAAFPTSLDIQKFPAEEPTQVFAEQVLDTLVAMKDGKVVPRLAESWSNPDPLTWSFQLRKGVKFSDGSAFSSADVKASIDRLIAIESVLKPLLTTITDMDVSDPDKLIVKTNSPLGTFLATLSMVYVGQASAINDDAYWLKPIGTGPFKVDSYATDDKIVMSRNDGYWGKKTKLDTLEFRSIPEASARITALETGEIGATSNVAPDQTAGLKSADGVKFQTTTSYYYYLNWFNNQRAPFTDERVRQAMWHAVDFKKIVPALFGDAATLGQAPISQEVFGAPQLKPYTFDKVKAKKLLADAGFPNGFETTMMWPQEGGANIKALAQSMISAWAEIGVTVKPIELERANWVTDLNALNWDMTLFVNSTATGDADYTLNRLYPCAAKRLGFCDPEIDKQLASARGSVDQAERKTIYGDVSKSLWERAVGIFPADLSVNLAYLSTLSGVTMPPNGRPSFATVSVTK